MANSDTTDTLTAAKKTDEKQLRADAVNDLPVIAAAEAEGLIAHLEKTFVKHFSNFTPGTEIHAALANFYNELKSGAEQLLGIEPKAAPAPTATPAPAPTATPTAAAPASTDGATA